MQACHHKGETQHRVLLIAQFGSTGGTRSYAQRLTRLLAQSNLGSVVIADSPETDARMRAFVADHGMQYLDYEEVLGHVAPSRRGTLLNHQPTKASQQEIRVVREIANDYGACTTLVSVGNPGDWVPALHATKRAIYLLHTYPHGIRARSQILTHRSARLPEHACLVSVSQYALRRTRKWWNMRGRGKVIFSTAGPLAPPPTEEVVSGLVLTVGHVETYKNPIAWIKMAGRILRDPSLAHVQFVWIGEGSLLDSCRYRVASLGLADQIHFMGPRHDVDDYLATTDVYVQLSDVESLGLGVLEAARRGIPSVVARTGGLPETVVNGETGVVVARGDWRGAADAVASLYRSRDLRRQMSEATRDFYLERFNAENWERQWLHLLSSDT